MPLRDATVVVPFRLGSRRFPRKALCRFGPEGRTLIEHALANATALAPARLVLTGPAADLEEVAREVDLGGFERLQTLPSAESCRSATERVVELFSGLEGERFISWPVDEPAIDPEEIRRALASPGVFGGAGAVTFYCDFFAPEDHRSPLSAKVVVDRDGRLLYMSRAAIPARKDGSVAIDALKKNVGVFVFRRPFLERLAACAGQETVLDRLEGLEQLRWLELGLDVRCVKIRHIGFGVDVPEQVAALEERVGWR